ncbi:hypothetical protein Nocox_19600 [Nonomuraea coxensis DSM 45129]|uniref:Uncharacterized protein n=1 Tax=Nonomuraea coxensis DSM 45129 TaxID=1122611 RepID=A0ABX8U315_9ACTN|nr:hypothetical protein [Nonomuraea coxensis]QYC41529.1 hypothetical protein Nocox_19600 [Nonomuraea coxensis DSM 45129]
MSRLRAALGELAQEAPDVAPATDLAGLALAGHQRHRRNITMATAFLATAAIVGAVTAGVSLTGTGQAAPASSPLPDLPPGKVGELSHAYLTRCEEDESQTPPALDCSKVEWRVVTRTGRTYRVSEALATPVNDPHPPVAISRDGRMFAYYSRQEGAHVVRDLVAGTRVVSRAKVKESQIDRGSMLAVSEDGRHLAFDPREGSKYPGLLIDVRTGRTTTLNGEYEAIGIKNGLVELIRYRKTDLWLMPVTGGGKPVRFPGTYIMFSEPAPDGRTVAAIEFDEMRKRKVTLLDAKTGRVVRKVTVKGVPVQHGPDSVRVWASASEVMVDYQVGAKELRSYAVNVYTGKARQVHKVPVAAAQSVKLPGAW